MKTKINKLKFIALSIVLSVAGTLSAQVGGKGGSPTTDSRLLEAVKASGLKHTIMKNGDIRMIFDTGDGRSQAVVIATRVSQYLNLEVREIWGVAWKGSAELTAEQANKLLKDNERRKIGAWGLAKDGNTYYATFTVKIAANADGESLKAGIMAVAEVSDALEKELTNKDEF